MSLLLPNITIVDKTNICKLQDTIIEDIKKSDIISYDSEFTGILPNQNNQESDCEIRYSNNLLTVKQFGLLRIGFTCIYHDIENCKDQYTTYEIVVLPDNDYKITTSAFKFLLSHSIDFNYQFEKGILYPGLLYTCSMLHAQKPKPNNYGDATYSLLNIIDSLFIQLSANNTKFILHNGWLDILFLYYSFYGPLQKSLSKCNTAINKLFPSLYDTKYICQQLYIIPTYLEYLFLYISLSNPKRLQLNESMNCKSQNQNTNHNNQNTHSNSSSLINENKQNNDESNMYKNKRTKVEETENEIFCENFIHYGWCKSQSHCIYSHNIWNYFKLNFTLSTTDSNYQILESLYTQENIENSTNNHYHSAGFDSFCTGYIYKQIENKHSISTIEKFKNLLCLPGKSTPLTIMSSAY